MPEALRRRRRPDPQPRGGVAVGRVPRRRGLLRPVGAPLPRPDHRPRAEAAGRRLHRPGGHARPRAPGVQRPPRRARLPDQARRALHQEGPRHPRAARCRRRPTWPPPPPSSTSPPRSPSCVLTSEETRGAVRPRRGARTCSSGTPSRSPSTRPWPSTSTRRSAAASACACWTMNAHPLRLRRRHDRPGRRVAARSTATTYRRGNAPPELAQVPHARRSCSRELWDQLQRLQPARLPPRRPRHHRAGRAVARPSCSASTARSTTSSRPRPRDGADDVEHLDVLDRRRRPVRHRRRPLPADQVPVGHATPSSRRATPSAARGTCSATPASAPTPTCSRSATRSVRGTARSRSPTATRSCSTSRTPPPRPASTSTSASTTASCAADWSTDDARWTHHRRAHRHRRDGRAHRAASCSRAAATTATTTATSPTSPGMDRFAGTIVHPQAWPEDLDYAGKRVVVIGSGATAVTLIPSMAETAGARHDAAALADATSPRCRPRTRSPTLLRRVLPARWSGPAIRWFKALTHAGASTSSAGAGPSS